MLKKKTTQKSFVVIIWKHMPRWKLWTIPALHLEVLKVHFLFRRVKNEVTMPTGGLLPLCNIWLLCCKKSSNRAPPPAPGLQQLHHRAGLCTSERWGEPRGSLFENIICEIYEGSKKNKWVILMKLQQFGRRNPEPELPTGAVSKWSIFHWALRWDTAAAWEHIHQGCPGHLGPRITHSGKSVLLL